MKIASLDPKTRMQYEAREKALKDMASIRGDGLREGKLELACNLLKEGMGIEFIIRATGLSRTEIEEIAAEQNN